MSDAVRLYLPWLLSAITIWMTLMAGNKHPRAWAIGLCNQALWLIWIVVAHAYGLLPMNIALWVVYGRNHLKWNAAQEALGEVRTEGPHSSGCIARWRHCRRCTCLRGGTCA